MGSYLYILKCKNEALYTGITNDLEKRYLSHLAGKGSKYCRSFKVKNLEVAWYFSVETHELIALERKIKKQSRKQKLKIIEEPELLNQFLEPIKLKSYQDIILFSQFMKGFCPCSHKGCKFWGSCASCIRTHLSKAKKPPQCFTLRPKWVKEVAHNYKLEEKELLDKWF